MTVQNFSVNPSDEDSFTGTLRFLLKKQLQNTDDMLPAVVVSFDRANPSRVQVRPQVMMLGTEGDLISRAPIASVPVIELGGGMFVLSFPLKPGDLGFIKANDRDISLFLQNLSESKPNTFRMHNFSDGVFIPAVLRDWTLDEEDADRVVLQSLDGTVRMAMGNDIIKFTAPTLEIDSDVTITGKLVVEDGVEINGGLTNALTVNGNERVNGNIEATGTITPNVPP